MKIYIRKEIGTGDNISSEETEKPDLKTAEKDRKEGEKIHICYHDGDNPLPCKLI